MNGVQRVFSIARRHLTVIAAALALVACHSPVNEPPAAPELGSGYRTDLSPRHAAQHMAAAANPLAAEAGREMLRQGGSAIDAAIAMQAVLTLVEPQSSGIGGGAFIMLWDGNRVQAYDGRETAPAGATERLFLKPDGQPMAFTAAQIGGRSVGTPGVLRALELAHKKTGHLPWARLFEPAIRLSEHGFAISPRLHSLIAADRFIPQSPEMAAYFLNADGTPKATGTLLKNPALAAVFKRIAEEGPDALYHGPIADEIARKVQGHRKRGQPVRGRPCRLRGQGACAAVYRLQALENLWHAAAVVGRDCHRADPRHVAGPASPRPTPGHRAHDAAQERLPRRP